MTAKFEDARHARMFIRGGNATFTLKSTKTGARFTYRVRESNTPGVYFVSLLTGTDNTGDYVYIGLMTDDGFRLTNKSTMRLESAPVRAIKWTVEHLNRTSLPATLEVWHEGKCGRCNRKLTVPESIESGFGPECSEIRARLWSCVAA